VAEDDREKKGKLRISCPCKDCNNILAYIDSDEIKGHLISIGFVERYTCWSWRGELLPEHDIVDSAHSEDDDNDSYDSGHDNLDGMFHDLEGDIGEDNHAMFQELFVDAEKPLYAGCKKFAKLSAVLRLFDVKTANGISDKGFSDKEHKKDGKIRHVADSPQWRNVDNIENFGDEIRNIWFGLSSDEINPFGNMSSRHSPKQPGNDIDVYLEPLIKDMKTLWNTGVELKMVYIGHRRSLRKSHPYYKRKKLFDGNNELGVLLQPLDGEAVLSRVRDAEKTKICQCLYGVKVPSGYSSNVKKLVSMNDLKLLDRIRHTITKLCLFFNMFHSKVIDSEVLDEWQSDIILTLCQLEMYFPPSFFDVMVHLVSHIVGEIKACGPTFLRNMYPFERYMGFLKRYVRNRYRPKASIIQGYVTEEGVGHLVGFKQGIEGYVAKKKRYREREVITAIVNKKIKEAREEMEAEYNERLATAINEMKSNQRNENPESPLMRKSDALDNIQEASKCQLFIPYGTNKVLCAIGMVYPSKQVHGKSVLQGHAKVHVDNVEAKYKDYLLPVPTEEFSKIGETVLSFIQWPTKYIELTKAYNSNQAGNKKIVATNTSTQTVTKQAVATNKEPSTLKQTSPTLSRQEGPSDHIAAAPLTKSARPLNSFTGQNYLLQTMGPSQYTSFFLAPYVESKHWNLFIIVPQQKIGFVLDSNMEGKNEESCEFTNCNQQGHYWECGYFVMKWMHQFVTHQQHSFPKRVPWNDKKPFTTKELDDIVSSCISVCRI
nr:hypothetical protein [Tanacetum cinerariifolium]